MVLALQVFPLLALASLAIRLRPFGSYSRWLGQRIEEPDVTVRTPSPEQLKQAVRIGWVVKRCGRLAFWTCECLPQAMVTCRLLRRAGIPHVAVIGATILQTDRPSMFAHAWVRVGDTIVCGKATSALHTPLACYGPATTAAP